MKELEDLLSQSAELGSRNVLSLDQVLSWIADYLAMREDEMARFPEEREREHWDILAADYDPDRSAMFVAAYFSGLTVRFLGGLAPRAELRGYAESEFPGDPHDLLEDLDRRFGAREQVNIPLEVLREWL